MSGQVTTFAQYKSGHCGTALKISDDLGRRRSHVA
jgi:hypothetical protein